MPSLSSIALFPLQLAGTVTRIPAAVEAVISLHKIVAAMEEIKANTDVLTEVRAALVQVAAHTDGLGDVTHATTSMEEHTGTIVGYMPGLANLGEVLPPLFPMMQTLAEGLERLDTRLGQLEEQLESLSVAVTPLGAATQRLRLAGRNRRVDS